MMRKLMLSIAVAATATAFAAPAATPVWRDPAVNQVNREARRAHFFAFENADLAAKGDMSSRHATYPWKACGASTS